MGGDGRGFGSCLVSASPEGIRREPQGCPGEDTDGEESQKERRQLPQHERRSNMPGPGTQGEENGLRSAEGVREPVSMERLVQVTGRGGGQLLCRGEKYCAKFWGKKNKKNGGMGYMSKCSNSRKAKK